MTKELLIKLIIFSALCAISAFILVGVFKGENIPRCYSILAGVISMIITNKILK
jgi:hypothetical protein